MLYVQVHSEQEVSTVQLCEIRVSVSYDREEAAHGWGFLLWHPLEKAQALSNTYWNGDLRVGNGLLCSSLASMSTILKLLVEGQCYFMDYLGCCLEKSSEVSWSVF